MNKGRTRNVASPCLPEMLPDRFSYSTTTWFFFWSFLISTMNHHQLPDTSERCPSPWQFHLDWYIFFTHGIKGLGQRDCEINCARGLCCCTELAGSVFLSSRVEHIWSLEHSSPCSYLPAVLHILVNSSITMLCITCLFVTYWHDCFVHILNKHFESIPFTKDWNAL